MLSETVVARSAAKVNLTLEVGLLRPDGYHDIRSVVQTIGIYDHLRIEHRDRDLTLECNWPELQTEENLCLRAARLVKEALHVNAGCHIVLEKSIPTGAGLGGGSGNCAAVLASLARLWNLPYQNVKLLPLARVLGADVPLFLEGGCLLMEGIGERIQPISNLAPWHVVVVKPEASIPTGEVYQAMDRIERHNRPDHEAVMQALHKEDLDRLQGLVRNEMEDVVLERWPEVTTAKGALLEAGAGSAVMTGSGSAVYTVVESEATAKAIAGKVERFRAVFTAPFVNHGFEINMR